MLGAWLIYLTLETGRVFSVPAEGWTIATQPGIEASCGPVTLNASWAFDRTGRFERDLAVSVDHDFGERLTVTATASRYDYPGYDRDLAWSVSAKWRIK